MFGCGKKKIVKTALTQEELNRLMAGMNSKQLKEFRKRQKELEDEEFDDFEDGFLMGMIFDDD